MDYLTLKHAHAGLAYLSITLFAGRAALAYLRPSLLQHRLLRVAPHAIDTLLLAAALALVWWAGLSPHHQPWLAAKIAALLLYIVLGYLGLKRLSASPWRAPVLLAALGTALYIVAVAKSKLPWPF